MEANAFTQDLSTLVDFQALAKAQPDTDNSLSFTNISMPMFSDQLLCDASTGTPCPFIPETFRLTVYNSLHNISHPGIRASKHLIASCFIWPGMNADIAKWARSCLQCQRAKVHCYTVTPLATFNTSDACFDHVHIDLVGPLPTSQGCTYLLSCVDRFTHWPEAIPISDSTVDTAAQAFVNGWVGMPSMIRGQQFKSNLWIQLIHLLGTN